MATSVQWPTSRLLWLLVLAAVSLHAAESTIWIEGEDAKSQNTKPHPWYSEAINKDMLSGGAWLSHFTADKKPAEASYRVSIPKQGSWTLWARINPIQAKLSWRLATQQQWHSADVSKATDQINLAKDGKPDLRFLAWVRLGDCTLAAGDQQISFRFHSNNHAHGALDCFLFTQAHFLPNGKHQPDGKQSLPTAEPGHFNFAPGIDSFTDTALVDLRYLNEKRAGDSGFLQRSGDQFQRGDGQPIRFWGANAGPADSPAGADYLARRLAKCGFNMARLHGLVADANGTDPHALNATKVDKVFRQVQAFADAGIYTKLSVYFPLWYKLRTDNGIAGGRIGAHPFGLLFFEKPFQDMYRAWMKELLTTVNPYTGRSLATDPAVGIIEIQNEDSCFFWTFTEKNLGAEPWQRLEMQFGTWAAKRYGTLAKAFKKWGPGHKHDQVKTERAGLYDAWFMTSNATTKRPELASRIGDQIRFLAQLQHEFYTKMQDYIKEDLGYRGLISASNWTTADNSRLLAIERWTYTATDVIDKHGYFGCEHKGDSASWSVRPGQSYSERSALHRPWATPLPYVQLAGRPHIHSEIAWNGPNRLNAEHPLLLAAYGSLQGTDGFCLFATKRGTWNSDATAKWPLMTPAVCGQSPAAALSYRLGMITESEAILRQLSTVEETCSLQVPGFSEGRNDDFRTTDHQTTATAQNPLLCLVGKVERVLTDLPGKNLPKQERKADRQLLQRCIQTDKKTVTSSTNELQWDWGNGLLRVDTKRCQAIAGKLAAGGEQQLSSCRIRCSNTYASIIIVSLDQQPIAQSRRILIQAFSRAHLHGFSSKQGRITHIGQAPYQVEDIKAAIQFTGKAFTRAQACDGHGYPMTELPVTNGRIQLAPNALYTVLER